MRTRHTVSVGVRAAFATSFSERLAETIAWCAPRAQLADAKQSLRSVELQPWVLAPDRATTVSDIAERRARCIRTKPSPVTRYVDLLGGRLLVYFPDANLADGAAEVQSHGFFDVDNTPPWDTWVALGVDAESQAVSYKAYVIAWVPPMLVDLANSGIEVNPEACICWLEDADIGAQTELRPFWR